MATEAGPSGQGAKVLTRVRALLPACQLGHLPRWCHAGLLAEHPLVGTACPESWGGQSWRENPPVLQIHMCSHRLLTSSLSLLSDDKRQTDRQTLSQGSSWPLCWRQKGNVGAEAYWERAEWVWSRKASKAPYKEESDPG